MQLSRLCVFRPPLTVRQNQKKTSLKPDLYDTPSTPSKRWLFLNPFDAGSSTFPSAPPRHSPPTTPPSIPPKSLPWGSIDHPTSTSHLMAYGSALNSSPWLFRRLSRVERPATAPRHPPSLRLPATFPSLALIEVTIGNTPGTGRCSLAVTHAPTTPFSHLGGPSACKRDQGAVVRTPGGTLG